MTLSEEQFNKLTTKEEFEELKDDVLEIKQDVKQIINSVDDLTKEFKDNKEERTANQAAHDRIQEDVNEVRGHVGLKVKHPIINPGNP